MKSPNFSLINYLMAAFKVHSNLVVFQVFFCCCCCSDSSYNLEKSYYEIISLKYEHILAPCLFCFIREHIIHHRCLFKFPFHIFYMFLITRVRSVLDLWLFPTFVLWNHVWKKSKVANNVIWKWKQHNNKRVYEYETWFWRKQYTNINTFVITP